MMDREGREVLWDANKSNDDEISDPEYLENISNLKEKEEFQSEFDSPFHEASIDDDGVQEVNKKKRRRCNGNMSSIIRSLMGELIIVELKNNTEIKGVLEKVDDYLNLTLKSVTQMYVDGSSCSMDELYVHGTTVRYVHISDDINLRTHVSKYYKNVQDFAKRQGPRGIK